MSEKNKANDEERLCPACRSDISVWATKCKFYGSEVGRPRMRETRLTLKDLGGESCSTHRVSKHVMGAMGAFRYDEVYAKNADKNSPEEPAIEGHPPQNDAAQKLSIAKTCFLLTALAIFYFAGGYTPEDIQDYLTKLTQWLQG